MNLSKVALTTILCMLGSHCYAAPNMGGGWDAIQLYVIGIVLAMLHGYRAYFENSEGKEITIVLQVIGVLSIWIPLFTFGDQIRFGDTVFLTVGFVMAGSRINGYVLKGVSCGLILILAASISKHYTENYYVLNGVMFITVSAFIGLILYKLDNEGKMQNAEEVIRHPDLNIERLEPARSAGTGFTHNSSIDLDKNDTSTAELEPEKRNKRKLILD